MRNLVRSLFVFLVIAAAIGWWLTKPETIADSSLPEYQPDAAAGERIFWAGGCASCHASPVEGKRAKGEAKYLLGGGLELETDFGTFHVPNISPHADDGIGKWSTLEFVNAMQRGVSPAGRHYYPAFPYTSYIRMPLEDVMDLKAYLDTLPVVEGRVPAHELGFPWSISRGIGLWKRAYLHADPVTVFASPDPLVEQGQALVEGPGHCGECHTPRDGFGGLDTKDWLAGALSMEGAGSVPNITPAGEEISGWSENDIAYYLESGFTPDFDTVGGSMTAVQEAMAELDEADRAAIAAYLKAIPAIE